MAKGQGERKQDRGQAGPSSNADVSPRTALPVARVDPAEDSIDGAELLRLLEDDPRVLPSVDEDGRTPNVRRMPEGMEVVEQRVGVAEAQWVLRVRCQCGRSWFEVEQVHWATCPRCSLLVRVNTEAQGSRE